MAVFATDTDYTRSYMVLYIRVSRWGQQLLFIAQVSNILVREPTPTGPPAMPAISLHVVI